METVIIERTFEALADAAVVDALTAAGRAQNVSCARELAAMGELYGRRARLLAMPRSG